MKRCVRFAQQIDDYVTGRSAPAVARWMAGHAAECALCRREEAAARELRQTVRAAMERVQEEAVGQPEEFLAALHARLDQRASGCASGRRGLPWARDGFVTLFPRSVRLAPLGAAAAAALLAALGLAALRWDRSPSDGPPPQVANPSREQRVPPPDPAPQIRNNSGEPRWVQTPPVSLRSLRRPLLPPVAPSPTPRSAPSYPGDLRYLNDDTLEPQRQWASLPADEWAKLERRVRENVRVKDDFITIPFPRLADASLDSPPVVAAVEAYKREANVIDPRLFREVTLQQKAAALTEVCDRLRADTGIHLVAGRSVADEKVTLFCEKRPLREVMRQLSRWFGYTWLRTKKEDGYRYELVQDLRSQLLEEELRNRDRHEALLALDQEMSRYRQYFGLAPDEALARAKTAPPAERRWLERYAGTGWGPAQLYSRLSPQDVARLRAGERVTFSSGPTPSEQVLPPELAPGVLQSLRDARVRREGDMFVPVREPDASAGAPPAAMPDIRPKVTLQMTVSDLGQFTLIGGTGINLDPAPGDGRHWLHEDELAVGISPSVRNPRNGIANARLARVPALQPRVSVAPAGHELRTAEIRGDAIITTTRGRVVTSADLLESLHRATGMPVVGDYYTRLFPATTAAVKDQSLFAALNQLCDAMRLRWSKEGDWLQFRSVSYFNDRLKEVPNRLLNRWAAARKARGALTLDDLIEIAQLADAQLDAKSMAEGARELHGLAEWDLAARPALRPHLRFLTQLTPAQRQEVMSAGGLAFIRMSLGQQQQFIALGFGRGGSQLQSLEELKGGTLRVDYALPGHFEWRQPEEPAAGSGGRTPGEDRFQRMLQPPRVRSRTREAALQAARRIDPHVPEVQIVPTKLELAFIYSPGPDSRFKPGGVRATSTSTLNFTVQKVSAPL